MQRGLIMRKLSVIGIMVLFLLVAVSFASAQEEATGVMSLTVEKIQEPLSTKTIVVLVLVIVGLGFAIAKLVQRGMAERDDDTSTSLLKETNEGAEIKKSSLKLPSDSDHKILEGLHDNYDGQETDSADSELAADNKMTQQDQPVEAQEAQKTESSENEDTALKSYQKLPERLVPSEEDIEKYLKEDEKTIIRVIKMKGGSTSQGTIRVVTNFSKASLSRILKELEERGIVHKEKRGKINMVFLRR